MSIERDTLGYLTNWKSEGSKNPLLIRGAEQVGMAI